MSPSQSRRIRIMSLLALAGAGLTLAAVAGPQDAPPNGAPAGEPTAQPSPEMLHAMMMGMGGGGDAGHEEFPPFESVSEGYRQVVSTTDGMSFYNVWVRDKDGGMLAELPQGYQGRRQFIATTVAGGESYAGLQVSDLYCYWKQYDRTLALMAPQIAVRSQGDPESQQGVQRLFTDRVVLTAPIVCFGPSGQPVIDMKDFLLGNAGEFFGGSGYGLQTHLATVAKAKAFPQNIEIAFEVPASDGVLKTLHYSISEISGHSGYQPRKADERVGYFTTVWKDLGTFDDDQVWVRYINRWHLEKREPSLKVSPPSQPIVFYIDSATPVRYRRWVKQGIEYWNKAFRQVGIEGAIEVRYQDAQTGAYMDLDPEDVRYNFIRWLANDEGTAIGPSRVNPETGQILDADIVLTDGFIRTYVLMNKLLPETAMQTFGPETLAWLEKNPSWDPRLRMASPAEADQMLRERAARGVMRYGGHPAGNAGTDAIGDDPFDGLNNRSSQLNGLCMLGRGKAAQMAALRMQVEVMHEFAAQMRQANTQPTPTAGPETGDDIPPEVLELIKKQLKDNPQLIDQLPPEIRARLGYAQGGTPPAAEPETGGEPAAEGEAPAGEPENLLDGLPEEYVGPLLADLVAHEVGHTLGLRHNFKASSIATMDQFNSEEFKGHKSWSASVMDYHGMNFRVESGTVQGDLCPIDIGSYDMWAIEYGYTFGDTDPIVARVAEPGLPYGTDEDTWGPDPLVTQWDLGSDPFAYAAEQVRLANWLRGRILDSWVKEGQSWARSRRGYAITLWLQTSQMGNIARWVGGSSVNRDKKGDPNGRVPIIPVDPAKQREALGWITQNIFRDEAFGLTPELLQHMTTDRWWDAGGEADIFTDPAFDVHDRIMGVQASALTQLMNPQTLQRVFDNESRVPSGQDAFTLPELFDTLSASIWSELSETGTKKFTAREPMVSSLRRGLQREHLNRLIDLTFGAATGSAGNAAGDLATMNLRDLLETIDGSLKNNGSRMDAYTKAHLSDARTRIEKALDAHYTMNAGGSGGGTTIIIGQTEPGEQRPSGR
ncbi:MAG: zinc-dependent metalloprotease [Phycisphaerales bacterium]|nr:zinc-dependent metalloprotease [Phycisphaerales bacterium]